jgi:hypothetical protein
MPQLWKSAKQSVAFGRFFLMRIPTAARKSLAQPLGFSTFTTGPATINQYGTNFHLRNYKGWRAPEWLQPPFAKPKLHKIKQSTSWKVELPTLPNRSE